VEIRSRREKWKWEEEVRRGSEKRKWGAKWEVWECNVKWYRKVHRSRKQEGKVGVRRGRRNENSKWKVEVRNIREKWKWELEVWNGSVKWKWEVEV
jgi:hypothetical protein